MNRLATDKRIAVIAALVEGTSFNATCRITGVAKHTVLKLLRELGCAAASYHNSHVRNHHVRRIQADEIWAFVYGKDKNLTVHERQSRVALQPRNLHRMPHRSSRRQSRPEAHQHFVCGTPESFDANGDAPIYAANGRIQHDPATVSGCLQLPLEPQRRISHSKSKPHAKNTEGIIQTAPLPEFPGQSGRFGGANKIHRSFASLSMTIVF